MIRTVNWPQAIVIVALVAAGVVLAVTNTQLPGWMLSLAGILAGPMGLTRNVLPQPLTSQQDPDEVRRGPNEPL